MGYVHEVPCGEGGGGGWQWDMSMRFHAGRGGGVAMGYVQEVPRGEGGGHGENLYTGIQGWGSIQEGLGRGDEEGHVVSTSFNTGRMGVAARISP